MKVVDLNTKREEKQRQLKDLIDGVLKKSTSPRDAYEIAAILESIGWNDSLVFKNFGYRNVFETAGAIWQIVKERAPNVRVDTKKKIGFLPKTILVIKSFIRGSMFALPMAISVFSMLTLRFSLWSHELLSVELATSIAIGTIMSFMAVGGFTQAIARRGFFYVQQGYFSMAKRITFYFVRTGYAFCILITLLFLLINSFFDIFPFRMVAVIIVYFFFLNANWLSVTIMYMLKREFTFAGLITFGIFLVYIFFRILKLDILVSQIIALGIISVAGIILVLYFFKISEKKEEKGTPPPLPRMSIVIYSIMPFFTYGFLYFTFLFTDRIIAWSTNDIFMPYFIWFRGAYELGLDLALLTLVIPMGVNEIVINKLMNEVMEEQKYFVYEEEKMMEQKYLQLYLRNMILVGIISVISALIIYLIVRFADSLGVTVMRTGLLSNHITRFVFIWAIISYTILSFSLMNAVILFSLSQPEMVSKSILKSLIVNIITGFLLSRWFGYFFAVFGIFTGSIVFTYLTTIDTIKVMKNIDYYVYASS